MPDAATRNTALSPPPSGVKTWPGSPLGSTSTLQRGPRPRALAHKCRFAGGGARAREGETQGRSRALELRWALRGETTVAEAVTVGLSWPSPAHGSAVENTSTARLACKLQGRAPRPVKDRRASVAGTAGPAGEWARRQGIWPCRPAPAPAGPRPESQAPPTLLRPFCSATPRGAGALSSASLLFFLSPFLFFRKGLCISILHSFRAASRPLCL